MRRKSAAAAVCLIVAAGLCFCTLGRVFAEPETYSRQIETIDDKKTTAIEMTAAVTAVSVAITLLPDDIGSPVAERAADLSGYLMVIVIALFTEKYLLTLSGMLAFRWVIPIALVIAAVTLFMKNDQARRSVIKVTSKIVLFSLVLWAIVPASISVINVIDSQAEESAINAIEQARQYSDTITENSSGESGISGWLDRIKGGAAGVSAKMEAVLDNFVEAIAVMIVTTCIIPLAAFAVMLWILKLFTGADIKFRMPKGSRLIGKKGKESRDIVKTDDEII